MGIVIAVGLLVSAPVDVLASLGLSRRLVTAGSSGDTQFVGAILSSVALLLIFAGPWLSDHVRFAYSLLAGFAFRIVFAVYDLSQNTLMALAPTGSVGRMRFAATRILFSGLAILLVAATIGPLIAAEKGDKGTLFLLVIAGLFAVIAILTAWYFARLLRRIRPSVDRSCESARLAIPRPPFQGDFWLLICLMFVTSCFTPIYSKLGPYFTAYGLRSPLWGGGVVTSMAMGLLLGQPLWLSANSKVAPEKVMQLAALLQLTGLTTFWLSGAIHPLASVFSAFVFGLGNGGVGTMLWGLFSGTVARLGPRYTGISYGLFAAASKMANASSVFFLGLTLAGIDFRESGAGQIRVLMTTVPAFGAILIILGGAGLRSRKASLGSLTGRL